MAAIPTATAHATKLPARPLLLIHFSRSDRRLADKLALHLGPQYLERRLLPGPLLAPAFRRMEQAPIHHTFPRCHQSRPVSQRSRREYRAGPASRECRPLWRGSHVTVTKVALDDLVISLSSDLRDGAID